jgi:hypothetical protein
VTNGARVGSGSRALIEATATHLLELAALRHDRKTISFTVGRNQGAELIAAKWADSRKVPQIAYRPDWTKHAKAAPFRRNDAILETLPIGVMLFPGTGIQENLADKAKKLGIPVWKFGGA